jgi:hypothetical protein
MKRHHTDDDYRVGNIAGRRDNLESAAADIAECDCGRGTYNATEYTSCYACYLERRADHVTCIECGVRWHSPEYALCYACSHTGPGTRLERENAARALRVSILERDGFTCRICGAPAREVDHVKPCAWGGNARPWNLQALCGPCNRWKSSIWWAGCIWDEIRREQMADYFFALRGFLTDEERAALRADIQEWRYARGYTQLVASL